jgi:hypothetical protein
MDAQNKIIDIYQLIKEKYRLPGKDSTQDIAVQIWTPYLVIILAVICVTGYFLWQAPYEVPMGDSYIHFVYAKNLVDYFEFTYNPGVQEGIGTTSFLWVIILASFQVIGITPVISSKILGVVLLAISGCLVFDLAQRVIPKEPHIKKSLFSTAVALLAVLPGGMIWIALSGMETILFLALGLLSLWLYAAEKWGFLGAALGLLALTRIEGIILAGLMVLVEFLRNRRVCTNILKLIFPMFVLLSPWLIYLQFREGVPFTTSFQGRQIVISEVNKNLTTEFPRISWAFRIYPLIYFVCWVCFILLNITGSIALPGPIFHFGGDLIGTEAALPLVGILVSVLVCFPLIFLALKHFLEKRTALSLYESHKRLLIVILSWTLLHNLAYAFFLPRTGAAGRYAPMNHVLFWLSLFIGLILIRNKKVRAIAAFVIITLVGLSVYYWFGVYMSNINYMLKVRKPAALFINEHYPPDMRIGATDLGPVGYYAYQPVVDLLGHVNKDFVRFYARGGSFADYLVKEELCYLMLYGSLDGAGLDIAEEMDLFEDSRFDLFQETSFTVSLEEWKLGNGPVLNYMPVVKIYRIDWHNQSTCVENRN